MSKGGSKGAGKGPGGGQRQLRTPLKHARLDYMVQKAVELGVSRLQPVVTRHTRQIRGRRRLHENH